jgi:hypothetical protein
MKLLRGIETHLGVVVPEAGPDAAVPADQFDGKVVYGLARSEQGGHATISHAAQLAQATAELATLEYVAQVSIGAPWLGFGESVADLGRCCRTAFSTSPVKCGDRS